MVKASWKRGLGVLVNHSLIVGERGRDNSTQNVPVSGLLVKDVGQVRLHGDVNVLLTLLERLLEGPGKAPLHLRGRVPFQRIARGIRAGARRAT
jgi:hypothetical protein